LVECAVSPLWIRLRRSGELTQWYLPRLEGGKRSTSRGPPGIGIDTLDRLSRDELGKSTRKTPAPIPASEYDNIFIPHNFIWRTVDYSKLRSFNVQSISHDISA
jgi:hypothetical protein